MALSESEAYAVDVLLEIFTALTVYHDDTVRVSASSPNAAVAERADRLVELFEAKALYFRLVATVWRPDSDRPPGTAPAGPVNRTNPDPTTTPRKDTP